MAVKGVTNNPNGRPKGSKNKVDGYIREQFEDLLRRNAPKIDGWLQEVAAESAKDALKIVSDYAEFVLPKLARVEQQQLDGNGDPADVKEININVVTPKDVDGA